MAYKDQSDMIVVVSYKQQVLTYILPVLAVIELSANFLANTVFPFWSTGMGILKNV